MGLKNEETASSILQLESNFHTPLLLGPGLTCSRRLDLPFDRGWRNGLVVSLVVLPLRVAAGRRHGDGLCLRDVSEGTITSITLAQR